MNEFEKSFKLSRVRREDSLPEHLRDVKIVDVLDENGNRVPGKLGGYQVKLVPRDDGYGPNAGDREPVRPSPGLGGAAVELTLPELSDGSSK